MHSWTLLVASLIMSGCIATLLAAVWLFNRRVPGLWAWAVSFVCATLAILNYVYRSELPVLLGNMGMVLFTLGTAGFCMAGARLYLNLPLWTARRCLTLAIGLTAAVLLFEGLDPPRQLRFALFSGLGGAIYLYTGWLMSRSPRHQFPVRHLFAWACGLHGLFILARPLLFVGQMQLAVEYQVMLDAAHWVVVESMVALLIISFSVLMLVNEHLSAELRALAQKDSLTDVFNRRTFMTLLDKAASLARRRQAVVPLLVMDIDHFKAVNDRHGHHFGDLALRHFVEVAQCTLRKEDVLGRLGGEEFGAFLPNTPLRDAHEVAERLRLAVATQPLHTSKGHIPLTVSIGVAHFGVGDDLEAVIHRADQAMYRAKQAGRNQVVLDQTLPLELATA